MDSFRKFGVGNQQKSIEDNAAFKDLDNTKLLFSCPFKFEKSDKNEANGNLSDSEESLKLEELTDFNKIIEKHMKESTKMEFHEKFHTISKIQNNEIDKKLKEMTKNRNSGQIKFLIKK